MGTIAENIVSTLKASGVSRVYGLPGDSLNGLTDALRADGDLAWVHVRHEEAAAFAASADAAITGELAVCAASCGPGNLHLINGLFDANRSRVPVLAIAAHIPTCRDRQRVFPGDPSAGVVSRVQRVLRNGRFSGADAPAARGRHANGHRAARRRRSRDPWRRAPGGGRKRQDGVDPTDEELGTSVAGGTRRGCRPSQRRGEGDDSGRSGCRGCARRGNGTRGRARGARSSTPSAARNTSSSTIRSMSA